MTLRFTAPGISASPSEENMRYFNVMILGPAQSPYEGEPHIVSFFVFFFPVFFWVKTLFL
jgi:ubiquitin-protein ligase